MRRNQITITVERFGDQAPNGEHIEYCAYEDDNDLYLALEKAVQKILVMTKMCDEGRLNEQTIR